MDLLAQLRQEENHKDQLWDEIDDMFTEALLDPDFETKMQEMEDQIDQPVNQAQVNGLVADLVTCIDGDTVWADIQTSPNLATFANHGLRLIGQRRQFVGIEIPVVFDTEDGDDVDNEDEADDSEFIDDESEAGIELSHVGVCYYFEQVPNDQAEPIQMPMSTMSAESLKSFVLEQSGRWCILPDELQVTYLASCNMGELCISPVFDNLKMIDDISGTTHAYQFAIEEDLMACLGINVIKVPAEPVETDKR